MDTSGAKSQLAGIVSAIVVMFVLLFLTPVFKNMPQNVQGAIVIAAVLGLFNYSEWFFLWKVMSCQFPLWHSTLMTLLFTMQSAKWYCSDDACSCRRMCHLHPMSTA